MVPAALRAVDASDTWLALPRAQQVAAGEVALLGDGFLPRATNAYMVLEGVPLLAFLDVAPSYETLRWAHALWTAVAALALGDVLCRRAGQACACTSDGAPKCWLHHAATAGEIQTKAWNHDTPFFIVRPPSNQMTCNDQLDYLSLNN